jgi:hypothetical protein
MSTSLGRGVAPEARRICKPASRAGEPALSRIVLGGAVGTVAITLMMYFVDPLITGRSSDLARLLRVEIGNPHWLGGMILHVFNGSILFPLGFAFFAARLPGPWPVKGLIWGAIIWALAKGMMLTMSGASFFGYNADGLRGALSSSAGHLVYGGLQGLIAAIPGRKAD